MKETSSVVKKASKGLSMLIAARLLAKALQVFINFSIIKTIPPKVYGMTLYLQTLVSFITFICKDCFLQAYQRRCATGASINSKKTESGADVPKRVKESEILRSSKNLVFFL